MIEPGDGAGLEMEAEQIIGPTEFAGFDHLDRDCPVECNMPGVKDDAHAARADTAVNLVTLNRWRLEFGNSLHQA